MPVKRNKKPAINPWDMLPNFEDDRNFPLIIEEEDGFGNKIRMQMDHNMKLIPLKKNNDNDEAAIFKVQDSTKYTKRKVKVGITQNKMRTDASSMDDDAIFKSPIMASKQKKLRRSNENKEPKLDIEKVYQTTPLKGILKPSHINVFNTPELNPDPLSDKMMFSSPLICNTPRGKKKLEENKKLFLENLKNCKETPILAVNINENRLASDSLEYLRNDEYVGQRSQILTELTPFDQDVSKIEVIDISSDLFTDANSVVLSLSSTEDNKSRKENALMVAEMSVISNTEQSVEEVSLKFVNAQDRRRWLQLAKRRSRLIKRRQGLTDSFWHMYHIEDSLSIILKLSQVSSVQNFAKIFPPKVRKGIFKLGEGSFGEVFMLKNSEDEEIVVKFIPVESEQDYNGAPMTKYEDVLSEIVIAKELSDLHLGRLNRCRTFVQMATINSVSVVRGRFPSYFQTEWDKTNKKKKSENDNPKLLGSQQHWIVLQFQFAGSPLEDFVVKNWMEGYSILMQVALALACAENHLEFEHRDLHLGNVLVLRLEEEGEGEKKGDGDGGGGGSVVEEETFMVDGAARTVRLSGVRATIIDFTFSRINKDENVVYIDLAKDKDLFLGTGDKQFDVYRDMQVHNSNQWNGFNPKTNILWLDFLATKLSEKMVGEKKDGFEGEFRLLHSKIESCCSTNELIKKIYD